VALAWRITLLEQLMETIVVTNKDELKRAVASKADEIIVADDKLVKATSKNLG
jgi:hypothetical protein